MSGGANFQVQTMSSVPNFVSRNAAIPVLRSCLTAKPSTLSPRPTFHLHSGIIHLSLVFVGSSLVRLTLDQSLLSQLDSELQHLSTNQTLRFHVCRSLIGIASRCFHPHVPINTLDNLGYGCMIASFFCLFLYYYCLLYTSPSPRDGLLSRMPSSA